MSAMTDNFTLKFEKCEEFLKTPKNISKLTTINYNLYELDNLFLTFCDENDFKQNENIIETERPALNRLNLNLSDKSIKFSQELQISLFSVLNRYLFNQLNPLLTRKNIKKTFFLIKNPKIKIALKNKNSLIFITNNISPKHFCKLQRLLLPIANI